MRYLLCFVPEHEAGLNMSKFFIVTYFELLVDLYLFLQSPWCVSLVHKALLVANLVELSNFFVRFWDLDLASIQDPLIHNYFAIFRKRSTVVEIYWPLKLWLEHIREWVAIVTQYGKFWFARYLDDLSLLIQFLLRRLLGSSWIQVFFLSKIL